MINFGMCFSRKFEDINPLSHIGKKRATYIRLFELINLHGWQSYAVTRRTYKGGGVFDGVWKFKNQEFETVKSNVKMDLIFDWVGNLSFPPENEPNLKVVNIRRFKELTCDKWKMYLKLQKFMAKTFWAGEKENILNIVPKIKTDWVVVKPVNGLKGKGIFVGPKEKIKEFEFDSEFKDYIVQEFIDTSGGIEGIVSGLHDLRVVVINNKPVWCHVRTPKEGTYKANVGQGGSLTEIDLKQIPPSVRAIVDQIADKFYKEYDNPVYSIDFGLENGKPYVFEINDQIGFPLPDAKGKNNFLEELIKNFKSKLTT